MSECSRLVCWNCVWYNRTGDWCKLHLDRPQVCRGVVDGDEKGRRILEKVVRYKARNGLLYETATGAMVDDFSGDHRVKKVAMYVTCRAESLTWALWQNRDDVRMLLDDMEGSLNEQENQ